MWVADPVYEALPHTYVVVGVAAIVYFGNVFSLASGVVLIACGVYLWNHRRTVRRSAAEKRRRRARKQMTVRL